MDSGNCNAGKSIVPDGRGSCRIFGFNARLFRTVWLSVLS